MLRLGTLHYFDLLSPLVRGPRAFRAMTPLLRLPQLREAHRSSRAYGIQNRTGCSGKEPAQKAALSSPLWTVPGYSGCALTTSGLRPSVSQTRTYCPRSVLGYASHTSGQGPSEPYRDRPMWTSLTLEAHSRDDRLCHIGTHIIPHLVYYRTPVRSNTSTRLHPSS